MSLFLAILGIADGVVAIILFLFYFEIVALQPILGSASYLIAKGLAFPGTLASIIDMIIGVYLLLAFFVIPIDILTILSFIFLIQKAFFSFLA